MPDDLLRGPVEQAERSSAPVRAAALLRISRVETVTNRGAARKTFDGALESVRRLSGTDREFLLEQAAFIAAAVAPDLLQTPELAPPHSFESTLLEIMLDHGHVQDAVSRLASQEDASEFQFGMAHVLMTRVNGADAKLAVFRRAIEAWRNAPPYDEMRPPDGTFVEVFRWEWNLLPQEEALTLVREIVGLTAEQPEQLITAKYGPDLEITSWRAHIYFQLLDVLRRLDPQLADSLIAKNAQLKKAARRFPNAAYINGGRSRTATAGARSFGQTGAHPDGIARGLPVPGITPSRLSRRRLRAAARICAREIPKGQRSEKSESRSSRTLAFRCGLSHHSLSSG
jgi:hypothetical protein